MHYCIYKKNAQTFIALSNVKIGEDPHTYMRVFFDYQTFSIVKTKQAGIVRVSSAFIEQER